MSKLPEPPGVDALRSITADTIELSAGTLLARIYFTAGRHPSHWRQFRRFGPTAARWDHHLPDPDREPMEHARAILACKGLHVARIIEYRDRHGLVARLLRCCERCSDDLLCLVECQRGHVE